MKHATKGPAFARYIAAHIGQAMPDPRTQRNESPVMLFINIAALLLVIAALLEAFGG